MSTATAMPPELRAILEGEQHRAATAGLEIVDADDHSIRARLVPYDVATELRPGIWESFAPGAFARATRAPHRVKLRHDHNGPLIGHATALDDTPTGSYGTFTVARTTAGNEAHTLALAGTLDECSVEFRPITNGRQVRALPDGRQTIRHTRAHLLGLALVPYGAYGDHAHPDAGAKVLAVRDLDGPTDTTPQPTAADKLDARARHDARARLERLTH